MEIKLSFQTPAEVETECLAVVVVDDGDGATNKARVLSNDAGVKNAAHELIASGEVTGKIFENNLIHRPHGVKAKRLLLIGAGKAKNFST